MGLGMIGEKVAHWSRSEEYAALEAHYPNGLRGDVPPDELIIYRAGMKRAETIAKGVNRGLSVLVGGSMLVGLVVACEHHGNPIEVGAAIPHERLLDEISPPASQ